MRYVAELTSIYNSREVPEIQCRIKFVGMVDTTHDVTMIIMVLFSNGVNGSVHYTIDSMGGCVCVLFVWLFIFLCVMANH